ncbi:MAG: HAD-IIB family hydrolase [Vicinamibacterales bacterium]
MIAAGVQDLLVVTDLDGTLLDEQTYSCDAAREALEALARRDVPLVLATSKTQAEIAELTVGLPLAVVAIVEHGGAVVVPAEALVRPPAGARREAGGFIIELGLPREQIIIHLKGIAKDTGASLTGWASLTVEEIARLANLSLSAARRAQARRYDEPFQIGDQAALPRVREAASQRGLRVHRGGRFLHLSAASTDKGSAFRLLLRAYEAQGRRFLTVGLGDAPNDVPLLASVDRPVIVPRPDGEADPTLAARLPESERAPAPGPVGWNAAVLAVLGGRTLPRITRGSR